MAVWGMSPVSAEEVAALERDDRSADSRLVRQRSRIVLLAYELASQDQVARAARCAPDTVGRTLGLYRTGGRSALRPRPRPAPASALVTLAWQRALADAMARGPAACGVARPTWTAPLLAAYLAERTGVAVGERVVRRGLAGLGYVCRRPTWTLRHKAEESADYAPKRPGSRRS
jgi:transposase